MSVGNLDPAVVAVSELPFGACVQTQQRVDPAFALQVGPLIRHAQVVLDDRVTDGFQIDHAGVVRQMGRDPSAKRRFERRILRAIVQELDRAVDEAANDIGVRELRRVLRRRLKLFLDALPIRLDRALQCLERQVQRALMAIVREG